MRCGDTLLEMAMFAGLIVLIGCAPERPAPVTACPEPVVYSDKEQRDAAAELRQLRELGLAPTLRRWIVDYKNERNQLRAC